MRGIRETDVAVLGNMKVEPRVVLVEGGARSPFKNSPLKGIGVRDFYIIFIGDLLCYACFGPFLIFFDCFLIFDFFLQEKNSKIGASVLRKTRRIDPRTPEGPIP